MEEFSRWLGEQVGAALRWVIELLVGVFSGLDDFFTGFAMSLGMNATVMNLVFLVLGLYLLYVSIRKFSRRRFAAGALRLAFAVLLLAWLIR